MLPAIGDGEILHVKHVDTATIRVGDIVLFKNGYGFKAHRVIRKSNDVFVVRGDSGLEADTIREDEIVGKVMAKQCAKTGRTVILEGVVPRLSYFLSQLRRAVSLLAGRSARLPAALKTE